ncbi:hypothetical protein GUJ93_ZPchr0011g28390 [Zizania palustris]|uniref:Uncharacterized protein n=1 Tax=Zizania palustris TaxID=103762 RepID=A0A8J6BTP9_ZIZPA|nr:hypothetical protein GUJ93_ZPchr0011g28390 [Zizania palustris]
MAKDFNINMRMIFEGRDSQNNINMRMQLEGGIAVHNAAALDQGRENNLKHRKVNTDNDHRKQDKKPDQLAAPNQRHADNPRGINDGNGHHKQKKPDQLAAPNQRHADNPVRYICGHMDNQITFFPL